MSEKRKIEIPIWNKQNLTLDEESKYSQIGIDKLRTITDDEDCNFVLWIGNRKRLIKRKLFDQYINSIDRI